MRVRRLDLFFTALLLPLDALSLFSAAVSAYALRFSKYVTDVRPIFQNVNFQTYLTTCAFFVVMWMIIFAIAGLYSPTLRRAWNELGRIIISCASGTMLVIATVFFRREITASRFIILAVFGFSVLFVWISRLILRTFRHMLLSARIGHRHVAIIGRSETASSLAETYAHKPIIGATVTLQLEEWNPKTKRALTLAATKNTIDTVLLADPDMDKRQALDLIAFCEEHHLSFTYLADLFAATFTNIRVNTDTGVPIIEVKRTPLDGWGRIAKRAFDIVGSLFLIVLTSPIVLACMVVLAVEDGFPVIFKNERVGENGHTFRVFKLRSMWRKQSIGPQFKASEENLKLEQKLIKQKSIKNGAVYKIANDPRITPFGNFIRRWSLDELPNFWNVLLGDMSLVGPRPHQPREVDKYEPHQRRVLAIRPGITGMAQISGRSDLIFDEEARIDTWYIENWSPLLDIYILLKTPFVVLFRKGAY